jgi:hypothetical protein
MTEAGVFKGDMRKRGMKPKDYGRKPRQKAAKLKLADFKSRDEIETSAPRRWRNPVGINTDSRQKD